MTSKSPVKKRKRERRSSKLQQIQECTRSSVSHLAEKLSPLALANGSPHVDLLHEMCSNFVSPHGRNVFEFVESKDPAPNTGIGEIGVSYIEMKPETPPEHYTLLSRSISGGSSGNLAKHGARKTYLFYRNVNENEPPITAISLIDTKNGEEPPLGFEVISQTPGTNDANLTFKQKGNNAIHLCIYRGIGPPITRIGVVHIKKEQLPIGWHFVSRTPNGKSPELDSGHTILAYQRNYHPIIHKFKKYAQTTRLSQALLAQCVACLVCGIYSFDRQTFLHALEAFTILEPIEEFPVGMLADFISVVRDAITAYISFFPREIYGKVLKWANHVYESRSTSREIDTRAFINLLHLCMFLRYDDVRAEASMNIINKLMMEWAKHHNHRRDIQMKARHVRKPTTYDAMRDMVCGLVKHVEIVKVTQGDITKFLNIKMVNEEFTEWVAQWMNQLYGASHDTYYDALISCTMIILSKICSQQLPLKLTAKSETIKRRIHGMKLLSIFLSKSSHIYKTMDSTDPIQLILLRRVIFTSFVFNAITPIPALFKKMLTILKILWSSYRTHLKFEIGVLLDIGIIGLLQSKYCTSPQKIDLLRGLLEIFQNRGALINIFYNFDNDMNHWPICGKLVLTLSKLTESGINDNAEDNTVIQQSLLLLSRFMQLIAKYLKAPGLSAGGNIDEQENFDTLGGGLSAMLLDHIHVMQHMYNSKPNSNTLLSLYSGVSGQTGLSSSNPNLLTTTTTTSHDNSVAHVGDDTMSISSYGSHPQNKNRPSLHVEEEKKYDQDEKEEKISEEEEAPQFDVATHPSILLDDIQVSVNMDASTDESAFVNRTRSFIPQRRSSAVFRHTQHQEENMIIAKALKKSRSEKLKRAVGFLVSHQHNDVYHKFSTLQYIAEFLYTHESILDKEEVGEFISALETKQLFNEKQHHDLLMLYVGQLNFSGQTFDTAFRHFLTDSGFRLPKEAQKIERLLIAFSQIFVAHNPQWQSSDTALFLAYGVLLLNTELHDPRLQDTGNPAMSKQQFYKVVQSGDNKLDKRLLGAIYMSVKENPIEMDTGRMMKVYDTKQTQNKQNALSLYKQRQFRKECATLRNKSLAKLRDYSMKKHVWQKARQREIVKTLYGVSWTQFLGSITTILQQTKDPATQSICLDAIKYSCAAAICLHLCEPQLYAFLCDLAKFVYIEQNKHLITNARYLLTVGGEHLKQEWFVNVMNYAKTSNIKSGCEVVSHICNDMKCRVLYDANQKMLRDIEQELGGTLHLVHPDRKFIFSGTLTKQSTKGDLCCYTFYLFNDLLVYVSGNVNNYTVHRVLHLSLCKILDLRDGFIRNIKNAFRIVSPQKNILLIAQTSKEKHEWFQLIENAIAKQIEQRARWINENYQTLQEYHETARVSKYLGRNSKPKKHELNRVQNGKAIKNNKQLNIDVLYEIKVFFERSNPCKLCAKPFKRFTGKSKCPWCLDIICKKCVRKRTQLPDKSKKPGLIKVCDACYGAISYFDRDITQINNEPTHSIAP
eukprot:105598_1